MRKNFIRKKEDFVCGNCSYSVKGSGYTNHCPKCLFSRHVDEYIPGDRESTCGGLMAPVEVEVRAGEYSIIHKCRKCGKKTKNKSSKIDNFDEIVKLT